MPTEDSVSGTGPASSSVSLTARDHFFHGITLPDEMKSTVLGVYDDFRRAAYGYITDPVPSIGTPEPIHLRSLHDDDEQPPNTGQDPDGTLEQGLGNRNSTFASGGADLEEALHPAAGGDPYSEGALLNTKSINMWMMVLILGVLCIIVVPGLVLGFVTRQVQWGIALSSAIGTIVGVFAGIYYYHKR